MPKDIEDFENEGVDFLRETEPNRDDDLADFLAYDSSKAYTIREIQASRSLSIIEIAARLGHLQEKEVVRNRGKYWAIADGSTHDNNTRIW